VTTIAFDTVLPAAPTARPGRARLWTGRVLTALVTAFLLFDVTLKLLHPPMVVEGTAKLGYPESSILVTGVLLLGCLILYSIPPTAALGAVLLTGYLGGAVATHLRVGDPLPSHVLFPVYVGVLLWAGLVLRRPSLAALLGLPVRRPS
jgi:DoxX-like protein